VGIIVREEARTALNYEWSLVSKGERKRGYGRVERDSRKRRSHPEVRTRGKVIYISIIVRSEHSEWRAVRRCQ
jgi:hypothetical protein